MRHTPAVILAFACLLLSGCQAARPAPGSAEPAHPGRQLLSVNWGAFTCNDMNNIGFSTAYKALAADGVIMGNVRIHNRGQEPFTFNTPGFRLMGLGGYLDSQMKCPENQVPAGGMLQCGFVAPAVDSLAFDSFRPFFMRDTSTTPCFCQSPMSIDPFLHAPTDSLVTRRIDTSFDGAKLSQDINNLVQPWLGFADAVAEAFGDSAKALSQALSKTVPDALSLAEEVADSIFNIKIGFISEDPMTPTPVQQPAAAKPAPQAGAAPSTGSRSPDAVNAGAAPQKPLASNPIPVPVFTAPSDKVNAKAPTAEAPAAEKKETVAPSKPAVDASTGPSKDTPASSVPATTTPTPAADANKDKQQPSQDTQQAPAVTTPTDTPAASVPVAAAKPDDKTAATTTPTPQAEAPKTSEPAAVNPKPAADSKPVETPTAKPVPAVAPKTSEPTPAANDKPAAAAVPAEDKPAPATVQPDAAKPASSTDTPAPTKDADATKTTPQPATTPKPADVRPAEADEAERAWFRPIRPEADAADKRSYKVAVSSEREEPERYRRGRLRSRRGYYEA